MGAYGRLLLYVAVIKREVALKVLLGLLISATYIGQAIVMAEAVAVVFGGGAAADILFHVSTAAVLVLLRGGLVWLMESYSKVMAAKVKNKVRMLVFDKILRLGPGYLAGKRSGRIQSLILDGIESLEPFLVNYIPQIITIAISGLAIGIYLSTLDLFTGLIIIFSMLLCVVVPYLTVPLVSRSIVTYWRSYAMLNSQYVDAMQGMTTLKAFNASAAKGEELAGNAMDFYTQAIRNTTFSLIDSGLMMVLTSVASSVTVAIAAFRTEAGIIPVTAVAVFLFLAVECARPMVELNGYWHNSFLGLSVAEELFEIVDEELQIRESEQPDETSLNKGYPDIELNNVSFTYPSGEKPALKNVSLKIEAGQTVAFVGKSGSGKSTLVNLLLRFYDPTSGEIKMNGVSLKDYSIGYLQSKVAVVFQDTYLFQETVADNVRMAEQNAGTEAIVASAKATGAHSFIENLPQGYQTVIGERGATLSGGERQRIAIARAILKNAPVLILDEATSSVDAKSEALIQKELDSFARSRTNVIIAHRLSTVQNADKIYVLDEGQLVEEGTHEELLKCDGIYADLIRAQRKGTHEEETDQEGADHE